MDTVRILLEALVLVGGIYLGVRTGGIGLGLWGAVGVFVLVFVFHAQPGEIPGDAILVILAVITAASAMQAAGGIDYLVTLAEKAIRARPQSINIIAPVVSLLFCAGAGTGNIIFPLLPVIYEVSYERGIRPERALSTSVAASGVALAASPVSAAMAAFVGLTGGKSALSLGQILAITLPAALIGTIVAALVASRMGKDLADDPVYQQRLADGLVEKPNSATTEERPPLSPRAKPAALVFLAGVLLVVLLGGFKGLLPSWRIDGVEQHLSLTTLLIMVMLVVALAVMYVGRLKPTEILDAPLTKSGLTAIIALLGIAWLANTFIGANQSTVVGWLQDMTRNTPWALAVGLFLVAALTTSQSASVNTMIPLGLSLGIGVPQLAAYLPAMGGVMVLPANGSQLAAVEIDRTGSTRIGRYVVNHSFLIPTLIIVAVSVVVAIGLAQLVG